jgi:hypothetical protein
MVDSYTAMLQQYVFNSAKSRKKRTKSQNHLQKYDGPAEREQDKYVYHQGLNMELPKEEGFEYPVTKTIKCKLSVLKYPFEEQAIARCKELHETVFDGYFRTARYWCFHTNG